jgi:curved DNA-binding protein CbpA
MSSSQPDYYAVMGLNARSTQDEIKKRYRELARRYHPDVNHNPDAAQKIKTINEAYHILGDVERRATFDASRIFQMPVVRPAPPPNRPAPPSQPPRSNRMAAGSAGARPFNQFNQSNNGANSGTHDRAGGPTSASRTGAASDFDFDGFGRVVHEAAQAAASRAAPTSTGPRRTPAQRKADESAARVKKLVSEAQLQIINRNYADAERMCREAISLDRRCAVAYEMLGDCARKRGDTDAAIQAYSFAIQMNPHNQKAQAALDRLIGTESRGVSGGPKMARSPSVPLSQRLGRDVIVNGSGGVAVIGLVVILGLLYLFPGTPFLAGLSLNLVVMLVVCGGLGGFLLALYGGLRPQSQELMTRGDGRNPISLNGLLTLFALVWFGASLLAYVVVAVTQNRVSPSVLRAYALTFFLSVLVVFLYHPLNGDAAGGFSIMALIFGGNLLFPAILLGWKAGDSLRLGSYAS